MKKFLTTGAGAAAVSALPMVAAAQETVGMDQRINDIFAGSTRKAQGAASAGAFGPALALRLARAEARAAGGELARVGTRLVLTLPRLTDGETEPSQDSQTGRAAQSS